MRSFKRSLKSIRYYWKRSLLLATAFFMVTVILLVMASLQDNVRTATTEMERSIGANLKIRKTDALADSYHQNNFYPLKTAEKLAENKEVTSIDYMALANAAGENVEEVYSEGRTAGIEIAKKMEEDYFSDEEERTAGQIVVIGVSDIKKAWEFEKRDAKITSGRGFEAEENNKAVAIVSDRFLKWNFLEIGDKITLINNPDRSKTMTVEVIGTHSANYDSDLPTAEMNYIYVPLEQVLQFNGGKVFYTMLHVNNPESLRETVSKMKNSMKEELREDFTVVKDKKTYLMASAPLKGVEKVCRTMFFVTYGMLLLILLLITGRLITGRRREIGTWMSLGEKKSTLSVQITLELLLPVLFGMITGILVSFVAERQIGAVVMRMLSSFEKILFQISPVSAWRITGGTLLAGIVMSIIIMLGVTRKNPKELL